MAVDHDQIFKTLLKAFFREFLELFLPEEAQAIDFRRVEFLEQETFTDLPSGRRKQLDLVVKVGLKGGGREFILVHVELQAGRDTGFPQRMFEYCCQLFLRYREPVVPVAVFTDDAVWRKQIPDTFELKVGERVYVQFRYHLIKLRNLHYRKFLDSDNPLAYALMAKMRYDRRQRVRLKAEFLRLILRARVKPARRSLLLEFVETYAPLDSGEKPEFNRLVAEEPEYREVKRMITTYEKRGIEKGIIDAKQEDVLLVLEKKFGQLRPQTKRSIRRTRSKGRLDDLLLSALDAGSEDELGLG